MTFLSNTTLPAGQFIWKIETYEDKDAVHRLPLSQFQSKIKITHHIASFALCHRWPDARSVFCRWAAHKNDCTWGHQDRTSWGSWRCGCSCSASPSHCCAGGHPRCDCCIRNGSDRRARVETRRIYRPAEGNLKNFDFYTSGIQYEISIENEK